MSNLKPIQIRIEERVVEVLDEIAKASGVSRCDIIRFIILDKLGNMGYLDNPLESFRVRGKTVRTPPIKIEKEG